MRISAIKVSNHSRLQDLQLEIRSHAVIIGANDVGKSSLLRLLNLTLAGTTGQLYQQLGLSDLTDSMHPLMVDVTLIDFTDDDRSVFPHEMSIDADDRSESLRIRLEVSIDADDAESLIIRRVFPEGGHERGPTREQLAAFGWRYLAATRGAGSAQLDGPNSALQVLLSTIDLGAEGGELTSLLDDFNERLGTSPRLAELRIQVAAHLSRAMPTTIDHDDLSVRTATDPEESVLDNVTLFFERSDGHIPITEQSDGLRQLMAMTLFDLAEGGANVIAVDEPELHLHPSSQRTIAELFALGGNQKILATHSPYIVQRFEPAHVIAISPDRRCHQISARSFGQIDKIRAHWWSPRLLEVLAAKYVIIVEGLSDRIVVRAVAHSLGVDLDRLGVVVIELDGADKFRNVYQLIGPHGFAVEVFGLADEAESASWLGAIGGKPKDSLGSRIWVCKSDLEEEYCRALGAEATANALIANGVCSESAVLMSCGVDKLSDVAVETLAKYCRNDKVAAATAVSLSLAGDAAVGISSVSGLVSKVGEEAANG